MIYDGIEKKLGKSVQSLYKAMFGVHRNGLCYYRTVLYGYNFTKKLLENDHEMVIFL